MLTNREIDQLRSAWVGRYVRTTRLLTLEEYQEWVGGPDKEWNDQYLFGGEAIVDDFYSENGHIWLMGDEGLSWIVDEQTFIFEVGCPVN